MSDYLVDKDGPPDPEVERLEGLLGAYRFDRPPPAPKRRRRPFLYPSAGVALAAAAAVIALLLVRDRPAGWKIDSIAGSPRCGDGACERLRPGEWIETDGDDRARVEVADIGEIRVEPSSRLRLVATGASRHHLELRQGAIEARVTAPPRLLVVDTPTTTAVDLGCAYRLAVDGDETRITVTSGHVALEGPSWTSLVPAGASARASRRTGPGLPVFDDAPPALHAAAARLDEDPTDARALDALLAVVRDEDTVTLWHLLQRLPDVTSRARVVDRLAAIEEPAPPATRDAILRLDPGALEAWRLQLRWERSWLLDLFRRD